MEKKYDIIIIGGGPGGYVAAIRAAQLKKKVLLVEKDKVGGVCLNYGCIPTKTLLWNSKIYSLVKKAERYGITVENLSFNWKKMMERKNAIVKKLVAGVEYLLSKNGVTVVYGEGFLKNEKMITVRTASDENEVSGDYIILATGSSPSELPQIKFDSEFVIESKDALDINEIPESMAIIGGGVIGVEIATIFNKLGSKIYVLEILPEILSGVDDEIVKNMRRIIEKDGINVYTNMSVERYKLRDGKAIISARDINSETQLDFHVNKILLATGRIPNTENLGVKNAGIKLDSRGFVVADGNKRTSVKNIYAIGDVIGGKFLAHKASHEGILAVENICDIKKEKSEELIPYGIFTDPEIASIGITEKEAEEKGISYKVGKFPFRANGRASGMDENEGFVKIISNNNDEIIGAHILGANASELIHEVAVAISNKIKVKDLEKLVHIHPTLSEGIAEAILNLNKKSIHIIN